MKRSRTALLCAFCLLASAVHAQPPASPAPAAQPAAANEDAPIDAAERTRVVERIITELEKKYVFPELVAKRVPELRRRWAPERLAQYSRVGAFAEALNADLEQLFDDKHLSVRAHRPGAPHTAFLDSPAEFERFLKQRHYQLPHAEVLKGNVGYLRVDGFAPSALAGTRRAVAAAMAFLSETDALIIDVRQNGGGDLEAVAHLVSYFVKGRQKLLDTYDRITGKRDQSWTLARVQGPHYGTKRDVYVLTSSRSFSAAEEFAYDLQGLKRATLVGETTAGGANNNEFVRLSEHLDLSVPFGTVKSAFTGTNWEHVGVKPEVQAPAQRALRVAHETAVKRRQERAGSAQDREWLGAVLEWIRAQPEEAAGAGGQAPRARP